MAAALLLFLQDSSQGEVPIVKLWLEETTSWKVYNLGLDTMEAEFVIQSLEIASYELAITTGRSPNLVDCQSLHHTRELFVVTGFGKSARILRPIYPTFRTSC